MNEFAVRGVLIYLVGSVLIWFMRDSMIYNRAAYLGNPAWSLISSIYELFSWSWWILLCLAVVAAAGFALSLALEAYRDLKKVFRAANDKEQTFDPDAVVNVQIRRPPKNRTRSNRRYRDIRYLTDSGAPGQT